MEYIVIGLLLLLVGVIWFKSPNKLVDVLTNSVLARIKVEKKELAEGVYDKLPEDIKKDLPREVVVGITEEVIDYAVQTIKDEIK